MGRDRKAEAAARLPELVTFQPVSPSWPHGGLGRGANWALEALCAAVAMFLENNLLFAWASYSPTNEARHPIEH